MATGLQLLRLAEAHLGEKYENVLVPKDNPNWHGPWDCAEFASWVVFQKTGRLFGCTNNNANPAVAEAYSGAWVDDEFLFDQGGYETFSNSMKNIIQELAPDTIFHPSLCDLGEQHFWMGAAGLKVNYHRY